MPLLHGWRALSAAAAKAAPPVPWTSLSSIKVHRIRAPVGCSGRGKEGAEPPYLGRVQAPGAVCAMPQCASQKIHLGSQEPALALLPTPAWAPARENSFFYVFWGWRGARRPRFSPAGRGRGESREAMARRGPGSADTRCCSQRFIVAQTAPLTARLGFGPTVPSLGGCRGGGEACGGGAEGVFPPGCPSVLLEAVSVPCPCTNHAFLPLGTGQPPPTPTGIAQPSSPDYFGPLVGSSANIETKRSLPSPLPKPRGPKCLFPGTRTEQE